MGKYRRILEIGHGYRGISRTPHECLPNSRAYGAEVAADDPAAPLGVTVRL